MKTHNLKLKTLALTLILLLAGQSFAHKYYSAPIDGKKVVKINMSAQLAKYISQALDISKEDMLVIKNKFEQTDFYMTESNTGNISIFIEYDAEAPELEEWMFEDSYLASTESRPEIEPWMFEDDYLSAESAPALEDWMFEEEYYVDEALPEIEVWMLEDDYLESTECCQQIEDWMLADNYYESESEPEVEDWMFDLAHYDQ